MTARISGHFLVTVGRAVRIYDKKYGISEKNLQIFSKNAFLRSLMYVILEKNGRALSGHRTRHINIRYFFVTDRVKNGEVRIEYCPTGDMVADFFTKPLQGSLFRKLCGIILNVPGRSPNTDAPVASQECVGKVVSYANVVQGTHRQGSDMADAVCWPVVSGKV